MSYLNNLCDFVDYANTETEIIQGTCQKMCPEDEIDLRVKEDLVHILEVVGDDRKLVKSYCRSAADSNMAVPKHLRPYSVLCDTVFYLLFEVTKRSDVSTAAVYDFVNDRLRAVRQDMTIQRLSQLQCAMLLEPMIRFYVYFGYRLYGLPLKDYDPFLNKKYMLDCLKWFLSSCDELERTVSNENLSSVLAGLSINDKLRDYDRVLMESLYILCNLDDMHPLYRYVALPKELKMHPTLKLSYNVALCNMRNDFVLVGKNFNKLCPLLYCALCLHLPNMQRRTLEILSHAYHSKRLTVPLTAVRDWLCVASDWETKALCLHYGLNVQDGEVMFDKTKFNVNAIMHQPKIQMIANNLDLQIDDIFTYKC